MENQQSSTQPRLINHNTNAAQWVPPADSSAFLAAWAQHAEHRPTPNSTPRQ